MGYTHSTKWSRPVLRE